MSLDKTVLFAATCDGCGPDWWVGSAEKAPLFPSRTCALEQLRDQYEWLIERQIDGSHRTLCPACTARQECKRYGHVWYRASADDNRRIDPALHMCARCCIIRRDDAPPAGHPDADRIGFTVEQVAVLADLDASLSPKETFR